MHLNEVRVILPRPHIGQQQVLSSTARFKVLMCGRRWGKSLIAQVISCTTMLNSKRVAYITPEYSLAKEFFKEVVQLVPPEIIKSANKSELEITLVTGGVLKFFSGEAIDNIRGRKFHLVIIDEAAYIPDLKYQWENVIRASLTDYRGDAIFISTPKGKNFFNSLYVKGTNREDGYESFRFTTYDNPHIDVAEINEAKDTLPEAVFNQEYLAIPLADANNPFGTDNINKNIITELSNETPVVYGIDLAKYNDWTVIAGLDEGGVLSHFDRFRLSWELTKERIKLLPSDTLKVIDATGVGDVVYESLALDVSSLEPFKFTGDNKPKLIYELIKDVEQGNVKYNQTIADEMGVFEFKYSSSGHIKFEAAAGYHDDTIAALALANRYRKYYEKVSNWKLYQA